MPYSGNEKPSIEDLEHYGVKGMKWGVRKVHNDRVNASRKTLDKVASGKGSFREKLRVVDNSKVYDLATKGIKGTAKLHSEQLKQHQDRLNNGKATTMDKIAMYGNLSPLDIHRAMKEENKRR